MYAFSLLNVKCGCNYKEKGREKKTKTKQKQINIKKKSVLFWNDYIKGFFKFIIYIHIIFIKWIERLPTFVLPSATTCAVFAQSQAKSIILVLSRTQREQCVHEKIQIWRYNSDFNFEFASESYRLTFILIYIN